MLRGITRRVFKINYAWNFSTNNVKEKVKLRMKSVPSFQSFMGQDKFSQISEDPIEQANLTQYEELVKPESTYFIETYG